MAGKSLVIVESSAKARTIQRYLGGGYVIEASSGHVMDLPKKELGVDIDDHFRPRYVVIPGKAKIVSRLKKLASNADRVFLALDPDREGEAIAWFLTDRLGLSPESARRVLFFEITRDAVRRAMENPGRVDMKKVNAQQARRILDRLVGYQISPILWGPFKPGISAGRVQTVALRLICEREKEIEAFESEEYWSITALLKTAGGEGLEARLVKIAGKDPAIPGQKEADRIAGEIASGPFVIGTIESRARKKNPPPPFITSTLQQEASRRLGLPASRTMSIAQSLYEGVDLEGERRAGLITYMRTDSVRMASSAVEEARAWIAERHGADYLPDKPRGYRSKRRVQDAHEAIRPTSVRRTPESVAKYLNRDQARLYELIWRRFVACQMNAAVFDVTSVDIPVGDYLLRATGSVLRFPGYLALAGREAQAGNGGNGDEERLLPAGLAEGDALTLDRMEPRQHFTQPPPRYSEGTLIKELESRDIGRPSTYATIVRTLKTRKYIRIEKKKFVPSFLGRAVNEVLTRSFPVIFEVEFTRRMESELDRVENGEMEWQEVLNDFYSAFRESLDAGEKMGKEILEKYLKEITRPEDWTCPRCGRDMVVKWSGDEAFLGCSGYPECQQTKPLDGGEPGNARSAASRSMSSGGGTAPSWPAPATRSAPTPSLSRRRGTATAEREAPRWRRSASSAGPTWSSSGGVSAGSSPARATPSARGPARSRSAYPARRRGATESSWRGRAGRGSSSSAATAIPTAGSPPGTGRGPRSARRAGSDSPPCREGAGRCATSASSVERPLPAPRRLPSSDREVIVVGGGLAGCEAAWQLASRGIPVVVLEKRPHRMTPAHRTGDLAELVCSNSLKSDAIDTAQGLLKAELDRLGSIILSVARKHRVPAGKALAVDRERFAAGVTAAIEGHPLIRVVREEVMTLPSGAETVVATGPLTSDTLAREIERLVGGESLYFYDAIAPTVEADSVRLDRTFTGSRYRPDEDDYLNCPLDEEEYRRFHEALTGAEVVGRPAFEPERFFEGCIPIEEIARRGYDAPRFGPMRPVGLVDPADGRRPHAVLQLRREDFGGTLFHMVGFQTRLRYPEQDRVFRLIPALAEARFLRYGSMHRNTYLCSPRVLSPFLSFPRDGGGGECGGPLWFAGQITGVEGYVESAATGLLVARNIARVREGREPAIPPETTMAGALMRYLHGADPDGFQPMNANFGLLPPLAGRVREKRARRRAMAERALRDLGAWAAREAGFERVGT
jgi:DNA topoisomerase-1